VALSIPATMTLLMDLEMRGLVRGIGGRFERTFGRGRSGPGGATG
jgi:hypothetical protein